MMYQIETKNPVSFFIENYLLCADNRKDAVEKFKKEFPENEVRDVIDRSEVIIKM